MVISKSLGYYFIEIHAKYLGRFVFLVIKFLECVAVCFEKRMAGHPKFKIGIIASNGGPTACGNPMSGHL
jgi:hypothetical protein